MAGRPGRLPAPLVKRNLQEIFLKKYLTPHATCAIIITVIGGTMVNPKYRKEVNKKWKILKTNWSLLKMKS